MKKVFVVMLVAFVFLTTGCSKKKDNKISVIVPEGTPLVALGNLIDEKNVDFEIVSGPALLTAALTAQEKDIVIAPINLGAKLYLNGGSKYKLDSIIVGDTNCVVTKKGQLSSISDLEGKNIVAYGEASTPGIIFKAALAKASVTPSNVEYKNSVAEVVALLTDENYVLVAEPTLSKMKMNNTLKVLDLSEALGFEAPQAGIFVNPDSKCQDEIKDFLSKVEKNITYLNQYPHLYADAIIDKNRWFSVMTAEVIVASIPGSNIVYKKAKDNTTILNSYYGVISSLLGGKVPESAFYY